MPNEVGSRPKAYVEYRPLLPTGGGPAGDLGDFATTAPARPRGSVPLAGTGTPRRGRAARAATSAPTTPRRPASVPPPAPPAADRPRSVGDDQAGRLISERQQRPAYRDGAPDSGRSGRLYLRDDVSTRRVREGEYTDDLRLDGVSRPYASAATTSGRRSSRNIASVERPNVRRRPSSGRSGGAARRPPARGGLVGQFLSDPRRALFALIVLLAIVLTAILTFSVSSCVGGHNQGSQPSQVVPVQGTDASDKADGDAEDTTDSSGDDNASDAESTDEGGAASDGSGATDETSESDATAEETVVEVRVNDSSVSWVEITCDGVSEVADSVTGPWSQTYTVHDSITIQVANPDVVTVTKNGERVELSPRAGGLGSVTIEGTPLPDDASTGGDSSSGASDGTTTQQ